MEIRSAGVLVSASPGLAGLDKVSAGVLGGCFGKPCGYEGPLEPQRAGGEAERREA